MTGRVAILALALVAPVVTMAIPVRTWFAQQAEIRELDAQVASATGRVDDLAAERRRWDDPAYVEAQARDRLHFVRPGEVGYTVVGAERTPQEQVVAVPPPVDDSEPWFARLWQDLRSADRGQ